MSIRFLDPDRQVPAPARERFEKIFALLNNAEYKETFEGLKPLVADDDELVRAFAFFYLGDLYHFQWDFPLSLQSYRKAEELFGSRGHQRGVTMVRLRIADVVVDEADSTRVPADRKEAARREGERLLNAAAADAEQLGDDFLRAFALHYLALFATEQGDYVTAARRAQEAIELRERIGDTEYGPSTAALLARAKAELGEFEEGITLAESTYRTQMDRNLRGAALRTLAIISYINDISYTVRSNGLISQFTAVEPIARTPFLLGEHSEAELAVAAHAAGDQTPLTAAHSNMNARRRALVVDASHLVFMLAS